ncbi:hypothetical protein GCM10007979_19000 [Nocardioides albus]|nr:hypothetical protein GCM10007979_19000 [Nocardioides albus]
MLQLSEGDPRLAGDLAHGRSCPSLLLNDPPQCMRDRFASLAVVDLLRHHGPFSFQYV